MNYFEIFNKIMLELNYRTLATFEGIYKSEHIKILQNINMVNADVLSSYDWCFLDKHKIITLDNAATSLNLSDIGGEGAKIKSIYQGRRKLKFNPKFEQYFNGFAPAFSYGFYNDKLLFMPQASKRVLSVFYTDTMFAKRQDGTEKPYMNEASDYSLLPMPYAEQILVYGTCLKVKANPSYPKFGFWNTMYIQALTNLRIKSSPTKEDEPYLNINGQSARCC